MYRGKRLLDVVIATVALVVCGPILALVTVAVFVSIGRPILFEQRRIGIDRRSFNVLKFRTMTNAVDESGSLLPDARRLTRVGEVLRRYSLDELPQLLNVLRGEMSVVGPRPLHAHYNDRFSDWQHRRHSVRPGITGLAQVSGRNRLAWNDRLALDVKYVDDCSFVEDVRILFLTIGAVFAAANTAHPGSATMPEFKDPGAGLTSNGTNLPGSPSDRR